jgi:hypothetical protein
VLDNLAIAYECESAHSVTVQSACASVMMKPANSGRSAEPNIDGCPDGEAFRDSYASAQTCVTSSPTQKGAVYGFVGCEVGSPEKIAERAEER